MTCSLEDATAAVPYATTTSSHRKIAAYYSVGWGVGAWGDGCFFPLLGPGTNGELRSPPINGRN